MNQLANTQLNLLEARAEMTNNFIASIDKAKTTKEAYRKGTKYFINYLQSENITNPTQKDIIDYKQYLLTHNEAPSINLYLTALKRLYKFLNKHYGVADLGEEIELISIKRTHKKDSITPDQAKQLLQVARERDDKLFIAILSLLLTTGLREIEIERANIEDLQTQNDRHILKIQGKGHETKDDKVIITDDTFKAISDYLATRINLKQTDSLFTSNGKITKGERLNTREIRRKVKEYLRLIGINTPRISTHSLRHFAIMQVLKHTDNNIFQAQKYARHTNPSTTQIYIDEIADDEAKIKGADILTDVLRG